jgi:Xaa-Pro aminopeptidase
MTILQQQKGKGAFDILTSESFRSSSETALPIILPVRQQAEIVNRTLFKRLDTVLPLAMREAGVDMWLIICQEDNFDPVFETMVPMNTWCPILQMLIFYDRGPGQGVERINLSMTETGDLYEKPWKDPREHYKDQWPLLKKIILERNPKRIGINIGSIEWAAGGLTYNLYKQLVDNLPKNFVDRFESAEPIVTRWLATLTEEEIALYEQVTKVAHALLVECFSRSAIMPNVTTTDDLEWYYLQRSTDLGLPMSFKPFFNLVRSDESKKKYGAEDKVIRPGDCIHSDVGIKYLRLNSDHQEWAYILRPGESDASEGLKHLMAEGNRLQGIYMSEFRRGLTGNQLLHNILERAKREGIPNPRVYSHSLGLFLHEPGPLIGLPWEQGDNPGRGDVKLEYNYAFTMELSVEAPIAEWGGQSVRMSLEQDVIYTKDGCRPLDGRQTKFHLV